MSVDITAAPKTPLFDSVFESHQKSMQRRILMERSPVSGLTRLIQNFDTTRVHNIDTIAKKFLRNSQRLKPIILEAWINNTISDAQQLEIPGCILKPELLMPLARYGVDRNSLLKLGLPNSEIDKLFRSLFVYTIGFYQMILKLLQHTKGKLTTVAGLWKVFAILLEYCCHIDYQMIVTTLNIQKKEELDNLEANYKEQLKQMQYKEERLVDSVQQLKAQVQETQVDLQREINRREELEDELIQKGSGHQEEVLMRLQFESKLNNMFAQQRDYMSKIAILNQNLAQSQKTIENKSSQLGVQKKRIVELTQIRTENQQEIFRLRQKIRQIETVHLTYEQRLNQAYEKLEQTNKTISEINQAYNLSINQLSQQTIKIDNLKGELQVSKSNSSKLELLVASMKGERTSYVNRVQEVEHTLHNELEKYKHYQQEYTRTKQANQVLMLKLAKVQQELQEYKRNLTSVSKQRDSLQIFLQSSVQLQGQYKTQVKLNQIRMEQMNRGRRIVQEQNTGLESRLIERTEELKDYKQQNLELKKEMERTKVREGELQAQITTLQIKLQSNQKQFQTNKETLEEKIRSLTQIINSEKKIRENWIYRYQQEQKIHNATIKELTQLQDTSNANQIKTNALSVSLQQSKIQVGRLQVKNEQYVKELLELRAGHQQLTRKNTTYKKLLASVDEQHQKKISEMLKEQEQTKEEHKTQINGLEMVVEDIWVVASKNISLYRQKTKELKQKTSECSHLQTKLERTEQSLDLFKRKFQGKSMNIQELRNQVRKLELKVRDDADQISKLNYQYKNIQRKYNKFLSMVPPHLKEEPDPFRVLQSQINQLEAKIDYFHSLSEHLESKYQQTDSPQLVQIQVQTELDSVLFDKLVNPPSPLSKGSSSHVNIGFKDSQSSLIRNQDFPLRKKLNSDQLSRAQSRQSGPKQEMTPVHLRSVYGIESQIQKPEQILPGNQQEIFVKREMISSQREVFNSQREISQNEIPNPRQILSQRELQEIQRSERLPGISRQGQRGGKRPVTSGPPPDIKRYISQANSRRRHDYDFM